LGSGIHFFISGKIAQNCFGNAVKELERIEEKRAREWIEIDRPRIMARDSGRWKRYPCQSSAFCHTTSAEKYPQPVVGYSPPKLKKAMPFQQQPSGHSGQGGHGGQGLSLLAANVAAKELSASTAIVRIRRIFFMKSPPF
jgi:hypothetical protein